jgi:hypothetical protein
MSTENQHTKNSKLTCTLIPKGLPPQTSGRKVSQYDDAIQDILQRSVGSTISVSIPDKSASQIYSGAIGRASAYNKKTDKDRLLGVGVRLETVYLFSKDLESQSP